jgi:glycolate dehydrogenase FAD-binding subunit
LPSAAEVPQTVAEAAGVLAEAGRAGRTVSIEREGGDVILSTRGLDRVLEHEAGDLTVTLEAGIRLSALNERLGEQGQRLALDPPGDPTIGAMIAGDLFGPRAHRFGRPRDLLLGVTVVLGDGTVANAGGKVVKNVAGYDLGKLFCGSRGRLGLIARACFRLHPIPAASRTLVVDVDTPTDAQRLVRALLHSEVTPSAADLLWPGRLAVLFEGGERAVEVELGRARDLLGGREDGDVWADAAERQLAAPAKRAFGGAELGERLRHSGPALVRTGPTCFLFGDVATLRWTALAERIRAQFDPAGVLA